MFGPVPEDMEVSRRTGDGDDSSCMSCALWAQSVGRIVGTVTDTSGAVITGAKITAVEKNTGFTRSTATSGVGTYTLTALSVGLISSL